MLIVKLSTVWLSFVEKLVSHDFSRFILHFLKTVGLCFPLQIWNDISAFWLVFIVFIIYFVNSRQILPITSDIYVRKLFDISTILSFSALVESLDVNTYLNVSLCNNRIADLSWFEQFVIQKRIIPFQLVWYMQWFYRNLREFWCLLSTLLLNIFLKMIFNYYSISYFELSIELHC